MEYIMDFIFVKDRTDQMSAATTAKNNAILYIAEWSLYLKEAQYWWKEMHLTRDDGCICTLFFEAPASP